MDYIMGVSAPLASTGAFIHVCPNYYFPSSIMETIIDKPGVTVADRRALFDCTEPRMCTSRRHT
eukprot:7118972-Heterocapsa_arctica.AAC.1